MFVRVVSVKSRLASEHLGSNMPTQAVVFVTFACLLSVWAERSENSEEVDILATHSKHSLRNTEFYGCYCFPDGRETKYRGECCSRKTVNMKCQSRTDVPTKPQICNTCKNIGESCWSDSECCDPRNDIFDCRRVRCVPDMNNLSVKGAQKCQEAEKTSNLEAVCKRDAELVCQMHGTQRPISKEPETNTDEHTLFKNAGLATSFGWAMTAGHQLRSDIRCYYGSDCYRGEFCSAFTSRGVDLGYCVTYAYRHVHFDIENKRKNVDIKTRHTFPYSSPIPSYRRVQQYCKEAKLFLSTCAGGQICKEEGNISGEKCITFEDCRSARVNEGELLNVFCRRISGNSEERVCTYSESSERIPYLDEETCVTGQMCFMERPRDCCPGMKCVKGKLIYGRSPRCAYIYPATNREQAVTELERIGWFENQPKGFNGTIVYLSRDEMKEQFGHQSDSYEG